MGPRGQIGDIEVERDEAIYKAFDALGRYKFMQFGYWAAIYVHLNRLCRKHRENPFRFLVKYAREARKEWPRG